MKKLKIKNTIVALIFTVLLGKVITLTYLWFSYSFTWLGLIEYVLSIYFLGSCYEYIAKRI